MNKHFLQSVLLALVALAVSLPATAVDRKKKPRHGKPPAAAAHQDGKAEARLIEIYRLIGQARTREALALSGTLVRDHPNFQLAQLVHGDLLSSLTRPVRAMGDVPETTARANAPLLADLREESLLRLKALRDRPPAGTVPAQFLALPARTRHAIAVDASRARLYLFENSTQGLKLVSDYYISVGKLGIEKAAEGDQRTPLGVYFITSNLDPKNLKDFYGSGALPINYPNAYDLRRGKTGSGIWLHGTPPAQFARAPKATDGCVVLANPDLERLIRTVEIRSTPVVIAQQLQWVAPQGLQARRSAFETALESWRADRASGDPQRVLSHYSADFTSNGTPLPEWHATLRRETEKLAGRELQLKDVSLLHWSDAAETMVVTFGEVAQGARGGRSKRQYWLRQGNQWKIFHEGVIR